MENGKKPIYPLQHEGFPRPASVLNAGDLYGLTKREYFAAIAMQATDLEAYAVKYGSKWAEEVANDSVQMADALLRALEERPQ